MTKKGVVNYTYPTKAIIAVYNLKFRQNNFEKYLLGQIKSHAKKQGHKFNLTIEDILIPKYCPYLGIKITKHVGKGKTPTNPSIDRIDIKKGYVKGNIIITSIKANYIKNILTVKELKMFAENILKIYN